QEWFLRLVTEHIADANPRLPLVLDQDPAAIVLAYSRMFYEDGLITTAQYESLFQDLLRVEEMLNRWRSPRAVLCLDAPAEVLRKRVVQRTSESHTPPLLWFERLRMNFLELFERFPNAVPVSTVELPPEQVISCARSLLEPHISDTHASANCNGSDG